MTSRGHILQLIRPVVPQTGAHSVLQTNPRAKAYLNIWEHMHSIPQWMLQIGLLLNSMLCMY